MADKAVSELIEAERVTATDLFVLEQGGIAKKLLGQVLLNWLTAAADGHGGISDISKISTSGLKDTYRITLADKTAFDFVVTNGANGEKGDDGAKGDKGDPGRDGISATHSWRGTVLTVTSASGSSSADLKGAKGDDGDDGTSVTIHDIVESSANGGTNVVMFSDGNTLMVKNGISATHSWSGTVLNVTSASGSSSADLKGDKGDPGEKGADGATFNLYSGTADFSGFASLPTSWIDVGESDIYGNKVYGVPNSLVFVFPRVPAKAGDTFTWSASVRSDSPTNGFRIYAYEYDPKNGGLLVDSSMPPIEGFGTEETTVPRFHTCLNNCMLEIRIAPIVTNASNLLYFSSFKLELGKVDQPRWCKAVDDLKGEKGDPGADGTMSFEDLTDAQKASLKGSDGSGINLYNGSADFSGEWENLGLWTNTGTTDSNGNVVLRGQCTSDRYCLYQLIPAKAGETFTLSALLRCDYSGVPVPQVALEYDPDTREMLDTQSFDAVMSSTEEAIVSFTHTCRNDCLLAMGLVTMTAPFYISSLKLESGKVENPRWCKSIDDVTTESIGAVSKSGDTMTGALEFVPTTKKYHTRLWKNADTVHDGGTELVDFDANNECVTFTVSAMQDGMEFTDRNGDSWKVAHAGNIQELLCTNLGYIEDIADYNASTVEELLNQLYEPGGYTFTDENPYQYFVEVREGEGINDPMVYQSYWSTEHGLSRILFRTGNLGGDEPYWGNWICLNTGVTDLGTFPEFCELAMSNHRIFFEEGRYRFVDIEENDISVTVERIGNEVYQTYWTTSDPMLINRRACLLKSGVFNPNTVELGEFEVYSPEGANELIVELDWEKGTASASESTINHHRRYNGGIVRAKDDDGVYEFAYADENGVFFTISDTAYVKVDGWTITKVEKSGGGSAGGVFLGRTVSILGDSISTYHGYIPSGNATFFPSGDVNSVEKTWWHQLLANLNLTLGVNESYSGSTIAGSNNQMASLKRIQNLGANGTPDIILFYGGTNDVAFTSQGTFNKTTSYTSVDLTTSSWSDFATAYKDALMRLQYYYPKTKIIALFPTYISTTYTPAKLNTYIDMMRDICDYFGVSYIDLRKAGLNVSNLASTLLDGVHPNALGMKYIEAYVRKCLVSMIGFAEDVTDVDVEGISAIGSTSVEVGVGENKVLSVVYTPSNTTQRGVTWESSNESVAKIASGVVTGMGAGSAVITATSIYNTNLKASWAIAVKEATVYTISNFLTHATNSNPIASVAENGSYSATITADSGYKLDSVIVTMGGVDVTATVYTNGRITIAKVTGDVSIVATAVERELMDDCKIWVRGSDFVNEGSPTTMMDASGNNVPMTLSGFDYTATSGSDGQGNIVTSGTGLIKNTTVRNLPGNAFTLMFNLGVTDTTQKDRYLGLFYSGGYEQLAILYGYVSQTVELFDRGSIRQGSQITINDNEMHMVAYTYDGQTVSCYLDGVLVNAYANNGTYSFNDLYLLDDALESTAGFAGKLRHFMLFNRALNASEINEVMTDWA